MRYVLVIAFLTVALGAIAQETKTCTNPLCGKSQLASNLHCIYCGGTGFRKDNPSSKKSESAAVDHHRYNLNNGSRGCSVPARDTCESRRGPVTWSPIGAGLIFNVEFPSASADVYGLDIGIGTKHGRVIGAQLSLAGGATTLYGASLGGLASAGKVVNGILIGGFGCGADDVNGIQFGGVMTMSDRVSGAQFCGIAAVGGDVANGCQFAGSMSYAAHSSALMQVSGGCSCSDESRGFLCQLSGLAGISEHGRTDVSFQVSGGGNLIHTSDFLLQVGAINVVKSKGNGIQIGVYNELPKGRALQIGLFNKCNSWWSPIINVVW